MKKRVVMAIFCGVLCLSVPNSAMASQVTQNFNTVGEEIPADEEDILPDEQQESKNPVLEEQVPQLNVLGSYRGAEQLVQQMIDGKKYLVYKDGSHYTGWYKMTETWILYFDPAQDGASATGITEIDEIAYIFNNDGLLCNGGGTPLVNGKKYWTNEDGSVNSGWLNLGNWKMYFDVQTYEAKVGLTNVGDKRYIFDDNGVCLLYTSPSPRD